MDYFLFSSCRTFDAHGNYHLKKDPDSVQDSWLEGVDWGRVSGWGLSLSLVEAAYLVCKVDTSR